MRYVIDGKLDHEVDRMVLNCDSLEEMLTYRDKMIKQGYSVEVKEVKEDMSYIELCDEQCQDCKQKENGKLCRQFRELINQ